MKPFKSFLVLAALALVAGCKKDEFVVHDAADVNQPQVRIGIMTGSTAEGLSKERFPKARLSSFDDIMDAITALKANQVDVAITAFPQALQLAKTNPDLLMVPERLDHEPTAAAVRKGNDALLAELNAMVAELRADGTLADMEKRWFKPDLSPYVVPEIPVPTTGTPLKVGVAATREPASFIDKSGQVSGFDGEIARRLAARVKRPIEFANMKFAALIPALQSGKIDVIVTGMSKTPERARFVDFSEHYFDNALMLVVRKPAGTAPVAGSDARLSKASDAEDKRVAVMLGTAHEAHVTKNWPRATAATYQTFGDLLLAVRTGKADVGLCDTATVEEALSKEPSLAIFGEPILPFGLGVGFNKKSTALRDRFAAFVAASEADGTLPAMRKYWLNGHAQSMPALPSAPTGQELVIGTSAEGLPFEAIVEGRFAGFDIELMERFGRSIGRPVRFENMPFSSIIAALAAGKVDAIAASIFITDERKKLIDFSPPYHQATSSLFARKGQVAGQSTAGTQQALKLSSATEAKDKRIAVMVGSAQETWLAKNWPESTVSQYHSVSDVLMAVDTRKADVGIMDTDTLKQAFGPDSHLAMFGEDQLPFDRGVAFGKAIAPELLPQFNAFVEELEADGTLPDMRRRWIEERSRVMPELPPEPAGKPLVAGVNDVGLPFIGLVDNHLVGLDVELMARFSRKIGRPIRLDSMMFGSLAPALASGKVDMLGMSIYITEERKKAFDFGRRTHSATSRFFALRENIAGESAVQSTPGFWDRTVASFKANILTENRYLLLWDGLKVTVIISLLSTLFGTLLGAGICMMRLSRSKLMSVPAKAYIGLLRGLPVLVLLMLIFYVIFASVDIPPVLVAVIAFGMNFGAYAAEIFRSGIEGIDKGQTEAGLAMGFTRLQTFLHIVLPQMVRRVLPVYKGEFISMI
ncbi:MAG: hypothetical protein RLZZ393_1516, partial [Pseudomonadota bacterium]